MWDAQKDDDATFERRVSGVVREIGERGKVLVPESLPPSQASEVVTSEPAPARAPAPALLPAQPAVCATAPTPAPGPAPASAPPPVASTSQSCSNSQVPLDPASTSFSRQAATSTQLSTPAPATLTRLSSPVAPQTQAVDVPSLDSSTVEREQLLQQVQQMSSQLASLEASVAMVPDSWSRIDGGLRPGTLSSSQLSEAFFLERERAAAAAERQAERERAERQAERERAERQAERERAERQAERERVYAETRVVAALATATCGLGAAILGLALLLRKA